MPFYYVDVISGAGKTHAVRELMFDRAKSYHHQKSILALPSLEMTDEQETAFANLNCTTDRPIKVTRFDSETHEGEVIIRLIRHMKEADPEEPEIIITTHAAILGLLYVDRPDLWHLYVDEVFTIFNSARFNLPRSARNLLELVKPAGEIPALPTDPIIRVRAQHAKWNPEEVFPLGIFKWNCFDDEDGEPVRVPLLHHAQEISWPELVESFQEESQVDFDDRWDQVAFCQEPDRKPKDTDRGMMIVFDVDGQRRRAEIREVLDRAGLEALVYSSARDSPEENRFRLILPIAGGVTQEEIKATSRAIQRLFDLEKLDPKANLGALNNLPGRYSEHSRFDYHRGAALTALGWRNSATEGFVEIKAVGEVEDIRRQEIPDDGDKIYQPLANSLSHKHTTVWVDVAQYDRFTHPDENDSEFGQIEVFSRIDSTLLSDPNLDGVGFASVTVMSANLTDTLMFIAWGKEWKPHPIIGVGKYKFRANRADGSFVNRHDGSRLRIIPLTEGKFSKSLRNKHDYAYQLIARVVQIIHGREILYLINKDQPDLPAVEQEEKDKQHRMKHNSHGLNDFDHVNICALLSAQNPTPLMLKWFESQGITAKQIKNAWTFQVAYQTLMRTSLRKPRATDPVYAIAADMEVAKYLHEIFPGSFMNKRQLIDMEPAGPVGRPLLGERAMTAAERKRRSRAKRKAA